MTEEDYSPRSDRPRGRNLQRATYRTPKRSSSLFSCFPNKKSAKQLAKEDLLRRVQRNSNRRCFTLPPTSSPRNSSEFFGTSDCPSSSIATVDDTADVQNHRRSWNIPSFTQFLQHRPSWLKSQVEANQSFLRAARSGNVAKITEHLNAKVDLSAVSSVSFFSTDR